jgi:hypothetical protein
MRYTLGLVSTLLLATACTNTQDLGNQTNPLDAVLGQWDGYVEDYQFMSGSDAIRIVVTTPDGASLTGTVVMGAGTPPAPPTDPNVGWPVGLNTGNPAAISMDQCLPMEGFAYVIVDASLTDSRLRFTVQPAELWTPWCALQTPYEREPGRGVFACVPNGTTGCTPGSQPPDVCCLDDAPIDCGKLALCDLGSPCACDATSCTAGSLSPFTFDIAIRDNIADGSGEIPDLHNLRLTRTK